MAMVCRTVFLVGSFAACLLLSRPADSAQEETNRSLVKIDYFFEPGCVGCETVDHIILPRLDESYKGSYVLRKWDTGKRDNYIRLVRYQERFGVKASEPVSMVIDGREILEGVEAIRERLLSLVGQCLQTRLASGWNEKEPEHVLSEEALLAARLKAFTLPAVAVAGLVDGVNPCVIGTLVFFMSLLAISRVAGVRLLLMGVSFCFASFAVYTAIGFGFLRLFRRFSGFVAMGQGVEMAMILILGLLAFLSFRDAYRYRKTGNVGDVTLQTPRWIKDKVHGVLRKGVRARFLILGGLAIGAVVTVLEGVCTGQVYIPTLVLMARASGPGATRAWQYLFLYNIMFIVPLVAVFWVTFLGLRTQALVEWSKRHVVTSKVLMAGLFLAMMALMVVHRYGPMFPR